MLLNLPTSYHLYENINEYSDIDKVFFQTDVGNITYPDLIPSADVKIINPMVPIDADRQTIESFDRKPV